MKIVKYGKIKPGKVQCQYCKALLKYKTSDVTMPRYGEYRINCPACKESTIIYEK